MYHSYFESFQIPRTQKGGMFQLEPFVFYYGTAGMQTWQPMVVFKQSQYCQPLFLRSDNQKQTQKTIENFDLSSREDQKMLKTAANPVKQKKRIGKDSDYKFKVQNMKRNFFSNITRHMISYVRNRRVSLPKVQTIISTESLSVTTDQFFLFVDKIKLDNYIRVSTMHQLWFPSAPNRKKLKQTDQQNSKILRIICLQFLRCNAHLAVQVAKRIRPNHKIDHHHKIREIIKTLKNPQSAV